ncbi:YigZ family protein [bacterium]|nr:YigZ family protein [bacterium]
MSDPDTYRTIAKPGQSELRIKASRFFGFAENVKTAEDADEHRTLLKKRYYDAAHQPFAYRLIDGTVRSSDDGEPKGTSGSSILKQIKNAQLNNVQVVVIRYFGGTKLGKGGLARAFSEAAQLALDDALIESVQITRRLELTLPHEAVNTAKQIMAQFDAEIETINYSEKAYLLYVVPQNRYNDCMNAIIERFGEGVVS